MDSSILTLKARNNHASALIVAGQYEEAYRELQMALTKAVNTSAPWGKQDKVTRFRPCFSVLALVSPTAATESSVFSTSPSDDRSMFPWPLIALASFAGNNQEDNQNLSPQDHLALASAIALFNMGLACHAAYTATDALLSAKQGNELLTQVELHYLHACEIAMPYNVEVLNLALFINLMHVTFCRGNLTSLHFWAAHFLHQTQRLSSRPYPTALLQTIWTAHLYYTGGLIAARAA